MPVSHDLWVLSLLAAPLVVLLVRGRPGWAAGLCVVVGPPLWFWWWITPLVPVGDLCEAEGYPVDDQVAYGHRPPLFPLTQPCNAHDDLVPTWVNAALVLLVVGWLAALLLAVRQERRARAG